MEMKKQRNIFTDTITRKFTCLFKTLKVTNKPQYYRKNKTTKNNF